jgi:diguanylate cyclase (GGDEF)-like protein
LNLPGGSVLGSFRFKLAIYFILLTLLPVAAAVWGFASASAQSEGRKVDTRLQTDLQVALARYQQRANVAEATTQQLANDRAFQVALLRRDTVSLDSLLRGHPNVAVRAPGFQVGSTPGRAVSVETDVVTTRGLAGTVVASVPLNDALASSLRSSDRIAIVENGRIVAASPPLVGTIALGSGRIDTIRVGGTRYRTLVAPPLAGATHVRFAVLTPQSKIDAANTSERDELLLGLLVVAVLVAIVAFIEGRSILRTLRGLADAARGIAQGRLSQRVSVKGRDELAALAGAFNDMADQLQARLADLDAERGRLRIAIARFGEALAATNDLEQLLHVVVETAVEATGATGATIRTNGLAAAAGNPNARGERLEHALAVGGERLGTLALVGAFDAEERMTAASLAAHAAVALENARLHAIVERQALVDGLTGIANRRGCEDALHHEIARAGRLGAPFTLVIADLDDFKTINDRYGHDAGDDVLREFASVLRHTLRESDLPGRWGGEEFVILLPGTDAVGGAHLAERVRASLHERSFHGRDGAVFSVTSSFGVAELQPGDGERQLFSQADRALYDAKRLGKDRVESRAGIRSL